MNFAPYQDVSPDRERALSPPISPRPSLDQRRPNINRIASPALNRVTSPSIGTNTISTRQSSHFSTHNGHGNRAQPPKQQQYRDVEAGTPHAGSWNDASFGSADGADGTGTGSGMLGSSFGAGGSSSSRSRREDVDLFETRLGLRMDYEACLAYLGVPPVAGVLLLVLEHRSDYVRFHAWQSSLLFSFLFIIHVIFSWSSVISWMLFAGDLGLIGYLTFRAYQDAETLDRCEVPFFGPLASSILDDE